MDATTVRNTKEALRVADHLIPKVQGTVPYAEIAILASERDELDRLSQQLPGILWGE